MSDEGHRETCEKSVRHSEEMNLDHRMNPTEERIHKFPELGLYQNKGISIHFLNGKFGVI